MGLRMCCLKALDLCNDCCKEESDMKDESLDVPNIIITPPTPVPTGTELSQGVD